MLSAQEKQWIGGYQETVEKSPPLEEEVDRCCCVSSEYFGVASATHMTCMMSMQTFNADEGTEEDDEEEVGVGVEAEAATTAEVEAEDEDEAEQDDEGEAEVEAEDEGEAEVEAQGEAEVEAEEDEAQEEEDEAQEEEEGAEEEEEEYPTTPGVTDGATAVASGLNFTALEAARTTLRHHVSPIERVQQIKERWTKRRDELLAEREKQSSPKASPPEVDETPTKESPPADVLPVTAEFSAAIALASSHVDADTASLLLECYAVSGVACLSGDIAFISTCICNLNQ